MILRGQIVTPTGLVPGRLEFDASVTGISPETGAPDRFILPGFIDTHVHGGDGGDAMDGAEGIATLARFHLRHGTTTLLPTTITRPWPEVMAALSAIDAVCASGVPGGARVAGAHLEGPFISPHRLGAQPPFTVLPTPDLVEQVLATGIVRVVTVAPEVDGGMPALMQFARAGVRVSLGHSTAEYPEATAAIAAVTAAGGTVAGTHLFNAMNGIAGRAPGLVGAVLSSHQAFAELILDTHHVHPGSFLVARAALGDRLLLITDAMRGAGLPDGESELGGQRVTIAGGVARLASGSLAGSVLTLDQALRNVVAAGVGIVEAARLTSTVAARYLGLADRGAISPGLLADFVVLDAGLMVQEVWLGGVRHV
jgi:N-acetylglucosamine-6-phosphate deacetylase